MPSIFDLLTNGIGAPGSLSDLQTKSDVMSPALFRRPENYRDTFSRTLLGGGPNQLDPNSMGQDEPSLLKLGAGRGSWYSQLPNGQNGQWIDRGDRPGSNALGVPDSEQGIALPSRAGLGKFYDVEGPDGQRYRLKQTDVGPAPWTGRGIDISAAAADNVMGYSPNNFPTDAGFKWTPSQDQSPNGPSQYASGSPAGMPTQAQDALPPEITRGPQVAQTAIPPNAQPTQAQAPPGMPTQGGYPVPPPGPQPGPPPAPGVGDRLNAGLQGFLQSGSPLSALGNLIGGITTGQRQDPSGRYQQAQAATAAAFRGMPGISPAMADAIALNPDAAASIAHFQPKLQETGSDPFTGQKTFAWVSPLGQQFTPAVMGQGAGTTTDQPAFSGINGQSLQALSSAINSGVKGDELYKHMPPQLASTVKAMIEGRQPMPSTIAMRSPAALALITAANAIDPGFDATVWKRRLDTNAQMSPGGKIGSAISSYNMTMQHGERLAKAIDALEPYQLEGGNAANPLIGAVLGQTSEGYRKARGEYQAALDAYSKELTRAFRMSGGNVHDIVGYEKTFDINKAPGEKKAALNQTMHLLEGRIQATADSYNDAFSSKKAFDTFLSPAAQAARDNIMKITSGGKAEAAPAAAPSAPAAPAQQFTPQEIQQELERRKKLRQQ